MIAQTALGGIILHSGLLLGPQPVPVPNIPMFTWIAGFAIGAFGVAFILYGLLGDKLSALGILTGKEVPLNVAMNVGLVLLISAVVIGLYGSYTSDQGVIRQIFDQLNIGGLNTTLPAAP